MSVNSFTCDNCKKCITPNLLLLFTPPDSAPYGWFTVKRANFPCSSTWHFCSKVCMKQWAALPEPGCQTVKAEFEYEGKVYAGVLHEKESKSPDSGCNTPLPQVDLELIGE